MKVTKYTRKRPGLTYPLFGLSHSARPDGGPVLVDEATWRTVNGFYFTVGNTTRWVEFVRHS